MGILFLCLFFVMLIVRMMVVKHRAQRLAKEGIFPRQKPQQTEPFNSGGLYKLSEEEWAIIGLLFAITALHGLLTEGTWGLIRAILGWVIIMYLGPMVVSAFWAGVEGNDRLAKACHKLLNWSVACLTLPILSLLLG